MEMKIVLPGGKKVAAEFAGLKVLTDQPVEDGGESSAPSPFQLFLASLGTCAGFFVLSFCQKRGIPTQGIELVQTAHWDETKHLVTKISLEIRVPAGFPEKYKESLVSAASLCTVKRHLQAPPAFEIVAR
jgi:ribosomal protein S12 methylthiotransferase accessory factor